MQSPPLIIRLLLIGLLPCIAAVLYFRGQHYDPALIDFKRMQSSSSPAPATSSGTETAKPEAVQKEEEEPERAVSSSQEIGGYRQLGRELHYSKDNLYEHVDGHAEYFISAGFQGLTVTDFVLAKSNSKDPEIRAEVYDMGKGIQAFGVLADESGGGAKPVRVGSMGYQTSGGIGFIKGRYYVKIEAFDQKAPLLQFARAFAGTLNAESDSFAALFSKFPDMGKAGNTRFIKEGYRGLDLLKNVIEREYTFGGNKIKVALLSSRKEDARLLKGSLTDYFERSRIPFEKIGGGDALKVQDKYEGDWLLVPSGDLLFGVFGTADPAVLNYFGKKE